jgi:hypothetical protein
MGFFELGGGFVSNMVLKASLNLSGANVSFSVLRVFGFSFDRFFTYSLPAPAGLPISIFKQSKLAGQPGPSNALLMAARKKSDFDGSQARLVSHPITT